MQRAPRRRYYGYRPSGAFDLDPRLGSLRAEWVRGKRCIDIGCHQGVVGLAICLHFLPQSYVGYDIDPVLVDRAVKSLTWERRGRLWLENAVRVRSDVLWSICAGTLRECHPQGMCWHCRDTP